MVLRATDAEITLDINQEGVSIDIIRQRCARIRSLLGARHPTHLHASGDDVHRANMLFPVMTPPHASPVSFTMKTIKTASKYMFIHLTTGGQIREE